MQNYGISGLPLDWFRNYLCNRVQYVQHNGATSLFKLSSCGVPQGSVLGPTMFLLYIDLPQSTTYFDFRLFADDSNIFHSFPPSQTKIRLSEITDHLLSVTKWCDANKITINIKKTNFMVIQPRRKVVNTDGSVELKGWTLNKVDIHLMLVFILISIYHGMNTLTKLLRVFAGRLDWFIGWSIWYHKMYFYCYTILSFNHMYHMALKFGDVLIRHTWIGYSLFRKWLLGQSLLANLEHTLVHYLRN